MNDGKEKLRVWLLKTEGFTRCDYRAETGTLMEDIISKGGCKDSGTGRWERSLCMVGGKVG